MKRSLLGLVLVVTLASSFAIAGEAAFQSGRRVYKQIGWEYLARSEAVEACEAALEEAQATLPTIPAVLPAYDVARDLKISPMISFSPRRNGPADPTGIPGTPGAPNYPGGGYGNIHSWVFYCDLVFTNNNPEYALENTFADTKLVKGDTDCAPFFNATLDGKALTYVEKSERKALFSRRTVCNVDLIQLVRK